MCCCRRPRGQRGVERFRGGSKGRWTRLLPRQRSQRPTGAHCESSSRSSTCTARRMTGSRWEYDASCSGPGVNISHMVKQVFVCLLMIQTSVRVSDNDRSKCLCVCSWPKQVFVCLLTIKASVCVSAHDRSKCLCVCSWALGIESAWCGRPIRRKNSSQEGLLCVIRTRGSLAISRTPNMCSAEKSVSLSLRHGMTDQVHQQYVEEVEAADAADGRGWDVIFYGDSIMEEWRWETSHLRYLLFVIFFSVKYAQCWRSAHGKWANVLWPVQMPKSIKPLNCHGPLRPPCAYHTAIGGIPWDPWWPCSISCV